MQETGNNFIHPEENILSIRLGANGFSFFVFNPAKQCMVDQAGKELSTDYSYLLNLIQAFREIDFLNSGFNKVYITHINERYTFIPLELLVESEKEILFEYNFQPKDNERVEQNLLVNNSCAVLFGLDNDIFEFLKNRYPRIEIYSHVSFLTEYFSQQSRSVRIKQMFVYLRQNFIDVYCFDRGFLSVVNSYKCNSVADFSYYILLIWKQLGMNQMSDALFITGESEDKEELVEMLSKFISKVSILPAVLFEKKTTNPVPYDVGALLSLKANL